MTITLDTWYSFLRNKITQGELIPRFFCINANYEVKYGYGGPKANEQKPTEAYLIIDGIKGIIKLDLVKLNESAESIKRILGLIKIECDSYIPLGDYGILNPTNLLKLDHSEFKKVGSELQLEYLDGSSPKCIIRFNSPKLESDKLTETMFKLDSYQGYKFINRESLLTDYAAKKVYFLVDYNMDPKGKGFWYSYRVKLYHKSNKSDEADYQVNVYKKKSSTINGERDIKIFVSHFRKEILEGKAHYINEINKICKLAGI